LWDEWFVLNTMVEKEIVSYLHRCWCSQSNNLHLSLLLSFLTTPDNSETKTSLFWAASSHLPLSANEESPYKFINISWLKLDWNSNADQNIFVIECSWLCRELCLFQWSITSEKKKKNRRRSPFNVFQRRQQIFDRNKLNILFKCSFMFFSCYWTSFKMRISYLLQFKNHEIKVIAFQSRL
jgi:hypothetical protein